MSEKKSYNNLKLNEYELGDTVRLLSFGCIKIAKNKRNNELIFLKKMKKQNLIDSKIVDHIFNELKILSSIEHPGIPAFLGFAKDEKFLYFAIEYSNGGDLFNYLRAKSTFSIENSTFYLSQMICVLEYLHSKNIIYRNLKPENLLIKKNGYLKFVGFEIAKKIDEGRTYTMCGTPEYLAPEIILCKGYGKPVDWWALGVILYEMIAGIDPFSDEDTLNVYQNILSRKLEFSSDFDDDSKSLIKHLLEPDLSKRFGNLKNGVNDIKNHPFFRSFNWDKLMMEKIPAPYIPKINGEEDFSHFNFYPDSDDKNVPAVKNEGDPFADW